MSISQGDFIEIEEFTELLATVFDTLDILFTLDGTKISIAATNSALPAPTGPTTNTNANLFLFNTEQGSITAPTNPLFTYKFYFQKTTTFSQTTLPTPSYATGNGININYTNFGNAIIQVRPSQEISLPTGFTSGEPNLYYGFLEIANTTANHFQGSGAGTVGYVYVFNITIEDGAANTINNANSNWVWNGGLSQIISANVFPSTPPCLLEGTYIRTPTGEALIEDLKAGDIVLTSRNRESKIVSLLKTYIESDNSLYVVEKNTLGENLPTEDLFLSGHHLINIKGKFMHPYHNKSKLIKKCTGLRQIRYYHIELENYLTDMLIANGVEVESYTGNPIYSNWHCYNKNECKLIIKKQNIFKR
jgi:hypothetical protein